MRAFGRRWAWLVVVAIGAVAGAVFLARHLHRAPTPSAASGSGAPVPEGGVPGARGGNDAAVGAGAQSAIPFSPRIYPATPLPAPAPTAIDRLKAAADAGNRQAACELGIELMHCVAGASIVSTTTRGPGLTQPECARIAASDLQAASRYLAQASAGGSGAARRALAGDMSVGPEDCAR